MLAVEPKRRITLEMYSPKLERDVLNSKNSFRRKSLSQEELKSVRNWDGRVTPTQRYEHDMQETPTYSPEGMMTYNNTFDSSSRNGFHHKVSQVTLTSLQKHTAADSLRKRMREYEDDFTTHGCTKLWRAERWEKVFWSILLLAAIATLIYALYNSLSKYYERNVFWQTWDIQSDAITLPAVTLCIDKREVFANVVCGASTPVMSAISCNQSLNTRPPTLDVLSCTLNGISCLDGFEYHTGLHYTCATFNLKANYSQISPGMEHGVKLVVNDSYYGGENKLKMSIHDFAVSPITVSNQFTLLSPGTETFILLTREDFARLPSPYHSACIEESNNDLTFMPGKYIADGCFQTELIQSMFKACGIVYDKYDQLLPQAFRQQHHNNKTLAEKLACLKDFVLEMTTRRQPGTLTKPCPAPCQETVYIYHLHSTTTTIGMRNFAEGRVNSQYDILIYYNSMKYTQSAEAPDYDIRSVFADFGGLVGLFIGASIMTVFEVIVYAVLVAASRIYHKQHSPMK